MTWGFFTPFHMATLLFVAVFTVVLHFVLKGRSEKVQTLVLLPMSLLGIAAIIFNLVSWNSPLEYLPLHLCSLNALVLPIVVITKNKTLGNVLLMWCLGAVAALVLNNDVATNSFFSWTVFFYYWPHMVEFAIPMVLFSLGLIKKDPKCILSTLAITMGIYTLIHFANLAINDYCIAHSILNSAGEPMFVNYMFSLAANNPLLELFMQWIPGGYWHMYLVLPILLVYLLIVYAPELLRSLKKKKSAV